MKIFTRSSKARGGAENVVNVMPPAWSCYLGSASVIAAGTRSLSLYLQSCRELEKMTTTTIDVSEALERVDNIVNTLDEVCDHMDGFSSAEEAWLSSITETLRTWRYVMQETYESPAGTKDDD
jgi:hypothetical protein